MNVLILGSGGREHALALAFHQSSRVKRLFAIPGNPGMAEIATCANLDPMENQAILEFALDHQVDWIVPGSEVYLRNGIVDAFSHTSIRVFGPTKAAARIESSKRFAKELMKRHGIPTARYEVFSDYHQALAYVEEHGTPIVLKYDGLAGGKGVVVAMTQDEAKEALETMLLERKYGLDPVVIEEYLEGPEFSLMCFVHNDRVIPMPIAQDHKRLLDGDNGPNTGGMGVYSGVPIIAESIVDEALETIMKPIVKALQQEGCPFTGFLYGGLMATAQGPKVIEFNARFGDPEAEVILPRLETDVVEIIESLYNEKDIELSWSSDYVVGVVMASKGYPQSYRKGYPIHHLDTVTSRVYHMGTGRNEEGIVTNGGRVLLVTGRGTTLNDAVRDAYDNVAKIHCDNLIYRTDIAYKSLSR